jgi:hypothetical protein
MALYQNGAVTDNRLMIGNYKVEVAPYSATAATGYVNVGAGKVNKFGHNITMVDVQAGNAPDPLSGVSEETFTVDMEMIEFIGSALSSLQGGAISATTTATVTTIYGGGNATITPYNVKLTNTRMVAGATQTTVIILYKTTMDTGLQFTVKSDNDADPINVMSVALTAKIDTARTVGQQLFQITRG